MTREEASNSLWIHTDGVTEDCEVNNRNYNLINKIYDHFEPLEKMYNILEQQKEDLIDDKEILIKAHCKFIEDYMSRTCESCKYFLIYDGSKQSGTCDNEESIAYTSKESIYGDDGCNKWESKDDK
jgi:hypothetical protein